MNKQDVFNYANKNWDKLEFKARYDLHGDNAVSIADQIQVYTNCSYNTACDIADSISISRAIK